MFVRNFEPKACNLALTGYQNSTSCQFASSTTAGPNGSSGRMITISSQGGLWILALKPDASIWYLSSARLADTGLIAWNAPGSKPTRVPG